MYRMEGKTLKLMLITAVLALLAACSSNNVAKHKPKEQTAESIPVYEIGIGDALEINVWKNPELSLAVPVRPDGKISMPLVGDVRAAGETTEKLAKRISEELKAYIRSPQVTVIVTNPSSADFQRRIRISGAVNMPRSMPYRDGMTILDLVLDAGGINDFASANKTKLYRKEEGKVQIFPIYLSDILNKGKLDTNYNLIPGDIITVPERAF